MTFLLVVGLNHQTAPLELRERVHCAPPDTIQILDGLSGDNLVERAVLSTCNRTELYAVARDAECGVQSLRGVLAGRASEQIGDLEPHLYIARQKQAVQHLFAVASGIESQVIGEFEILRQVRESYEQAVEARAAGPVLSRLFTHALHVGKRARSETDIGARATSVAYAAVELAEQAQGSNVLVVGAGQMGARVAQILAAKGKHTLRVANRDPQRAASVAGAVGGGVVSFDQLSSALAEADIVISATSAPATVIRVDQVRQALQGRPHHPLCLIDIALPRDIDPEAGRLPNVHLFNLDDLRCAIDQNRLAREAQIAQVQPIINDEVERFWSWFVERRAAPLIAGLTGEAEKIRQVETQRTLRRFSNLTEEERQAIERMTKSLVHHLLAQPIHRIKAHAQSTDEELIFDTVRDLFALEHHGP